MNGHSGAAGLVWRGKELSKETNVTANVRLSHLAFVTPATCCECKTVFSLFFFLLYLLLSACFVWATCALYSFILHKLAEVICHKSSKNYIPQYVWQRAWAAQSNNVRPRLLWWLLKIETWVTFYFPTYPPPVFLYPKATDFHLNDFGLQDVGCFSQRGKINQLKTMKMLSKAKCQHRKITICK